MTLRDKIENSKAFTKLEKFKQALVLKRDNRLQIEQAIVSARTLTINVWKQHTTLPPHWQAIVEEIINSENVKHDTTI